MVQKGRYHVLSLKQQTPDTVSFVLKGDPMNFTCGQFVMLDYPSELAGKKDKEGNIVSDSKPVKRAYSIASSAIRGTRGEIELCVKAMPEGWISQLLQNVTLGQEFELSGPFGRFLFDPLKDKDIVMIAAGSGIAPMYAFCEEICLGEHKDVNAHLIFSNKQEEDIIYREEFDSLALDHNNINVAYTLTREEEGSSWTGHRGRVSSEMLRSILDDVSVQDRVFFLCGPNVFVKSMRDILSELGVAKEQIRFESYG